MNTTPLRPRRRRSVALAEDETPITVYEYGPHSAPLTVVFVHGHCLHSGAWAHQIAGLPRVWGNQIRMITYDQRGHGESGHADTSTYTVDQLGRDLHSVLRHTRAGNVVLVGHSLGGMATLAYLRQYPAAVGTTVLGTALIATAAGNLTEHGIGRALTNPALDIVRTIVARAPFAATTIRDAGKHLCGPLIHGIGYGRTTRPALRTLGTAMLTNVHVTTMVGYLAGLEHHNEHAALPHLRSIPTTVICGNADKMTPITHSHTITDALPNADLTLIDGAGHMVIHERPTQVTAALARLLHQVTGTASDSTTEKVAQ